MDGKGKHARCSARVEHPISRRHAERSEASAMKIAGPFEQMLSRNSALPSRCHSELEPQERGKNPRLLFYSSRWNHVPCPTAVGFGNFPIGGNSGASGEGERFWPAFIFIREQIHADCGVLGRLEKAMRQNTAQCRRSSPARDRRGHRQPVPKRSQGLPASRLSPTEKHRR